MLASARNSIDTASSSSVSLAEASLTRASAFEFLDHKMTSIEAAGKVPINSWAFSKHDSLPAGSRYRFLSCRLVVLL